MKRKTELSKIPLLIGGVLIVLYYLAVAFAPKIDLNSASSLEIYQQGIVEIYWGVVGLIGWTICLVWGIAYLVRKQRLKNECNVCGAKIHSATDIFCRICGEKLHKEDNRPG